jgi:transposase
MNTEDLIRLEKYRQMKNQIRGSDHYMIVGIDVAKDKHHAFVGTATGKILLRRLIFENTIAGFNRFLAHVDAIGDQNGLEETIFGLEPTGNYHKPLGSHLIRCNKNIVLVSGVMVKHNRELLDGRWDKHDDKCAANIADLISQGKFLFYESPSTGIEQLRELLSFRRRLKKQEHSMKMRIRNGLIAKYFPEMDRFFGRCEAEGLSIIRWCLDPNKIIGMEFGRFLQIVTSRDRGEAQRRRLRKIYDLAVDSVGCPMGEAAEFEAKMLVERLMELRQKIAETADQLKAYSSEFPEYTYLLTIPGFGPYISSLVLAKIGNPYRFENRNQVIRLAGYDLSANRSGLSSDRAVPVISKRGNSELRYGLYQAAHVASSRNEHFIKYYTRTLKGRERERGIKIKMRVKLAAKMIVIAWTLMKKHQRFNPDCLNTE